MTVRARLAGTLLLFGCGALALACEEPGADFGAPCTSTADCPEGYSCFLAPSGEGACFQLPAEDGGVPLDDAGPDPTDAGFDAGPELDAGFDAGFDAGPGEPDAGFDAGPGTDAGPPSDEARLVLEQTRHHLTISLGDFQSGGLTLRGRVVVQPTASLSGGGLTLTGRLTQLGP